MRPVCRASRPRTSCRYSGIVKNTPIRMRFCENRPTRPARRVGILTRSRWTRGSLPARSRRRCHATNAQIRTAPAAITNGVRENPNGVDRRVLRQDQAPGGRLQDAQHDQPEAGGGQDRSDDVEPRLRARARRVLDVPDHREDAEHDHDLAHEHDPPRELGRRPARRGSGRSRSPRRRPRRSRRRRPCAPSPRSCRRSALPWPAARARRRCPRGSTSRASAGARSARPRSGRTRRRR